MTSRNLETIVYRLGFSAAREIKDRTLFNCTALDLRHAPDGAEADHLRVRASYCRLQRFAELMALEVGSIVRSGRQAALAVNGKGDRQRRVPLPPHLLRRLDRFIAGLPRDRRSDRIFLSLRRGRAGGYEPLTDSGIVFVFVFVFVATIMFAPVALLLMIVSLRPLTFMVVSGDERQRWLLLATPAA